MFLLKAPAIGEHTVIQRRAHVVAVEAPDGIFLVDEAGGRLYALNAIGKAVWEHLKHSIEFDWLCHSMAIEFSTPAATVRTDMVALLDDLRSSGLITLNSPASVTSSPPTIRATHLAGEPALSEAEGCMSLRDGVPPAETVGARQLSTSRRWLLVEAAWTLLAAKAMLRIFSFSRVATHLGQKSRRPEVEGDERRRLCRRVASAVDRMADFLPVRLVCFPRGIAAQAMLRRRGVQTTLYYGGRINDQLSAHVWVQDGNRGVIGMPADGEYTVVATYPTGK